MSSTNRGYSRHPSDLYITPKPPIRLFLTKFLELEPEYNKPDLFILDPCAGGNDKYGMPYPEVLNEFGFNHVITNDIRKDSLAKYNMNFLISEPKAFLPFDMVISNPPFDYAIDFIKRGLLHIHENGLIIMLLRLNFFGSDKRKPMFDKLMPKYCFVHSKRISFFPEDIILEDKIYKKGSTDSIEYGHFCFQKGYKENFTKLFVI